MAWNVADAELVAEQPITTSLMTRLRDGGVAPGTPMIARQNAAPLGWTKVTTGIDNNAMRLFTGTPSDGGSVNFSTLFGRTATDGHTLTTGEIPPHSHTHDFDDNVAGSGGDRKIPADGSGGFATGETGGGGSHTHPIDMRVKFIGFCLFIKD